MKKKILATGVASIILFACLTGCSVEKSISEIVDNQNLNNADEVVDAFESIGIESADSHSVDEKDGNGTIEVESGGEKYTLVFVDYFGTYIKDEDGNKVAEIGDFSDIGVVE